MLLEYGVLSKLTGKPEYYEKCKRGVVAVYDRRAPKTNLVGTNINAETGEWTNKDAHLSGCIDAYYEYLLKGWLLFGDKIEEDVEYLQERHCPAIWPTSRRAASGMATPTWKPAKEQAPYSVLSIASTEHAFVWTKT